MTHYLFSVIHSVLEEGQILEKGASVTRICIDQPLRLPQGVLNLRTVQDAIAYQTVDYVFPFSRFSFETDISFLVLSGGSSSPFFKVGSGSDYCLHGCPCSRLRRPSYRYPFGLRLKTIEKGCMPRMAIGFGCLRLNS